VAKLGARHKTTKCGSFMYCNCVSIFAHKAIHDGFSIAGKKEHKTTFFSSRKANTTLDCSYLSGNTLCYQATSFTKSSTVQGTLSSRLRPRLRNWSNPSEMHDSARGLFFRNSCLGQFGTLHFTTHQNLGVSLDRFIRSFHQTYPAPCELNGVWLREITNKLNTQCDTNLHVCTAARREILCEKIIIFFMYV